MSGCVFNGRIKTSDDNVDPDYSENVGNVHNDSLVFIVMFQGVCYYPGAWAICGVADITVPTVVFTP